MSDPRWNDNYPFWKQHEQMNLNGDWDTFYALLSRRLERLILYGETGAMNPAYLGDCLVTDSHGYFIYERGQPFHLALKAFFSISDVHGQIESELKMDQHVQEADAALRQLQRSRLERSVKSSPLFVSSRSPTTQENEAKKAIALARRARTSICRTRVYKVKFTVLQAFFKRILTLPNGERAFQSLRKEVQEFCASSQIAYDVASDGSIIRYGQEPLHAVLTNAIFNTGDNELNRLLLSARQKFLDRDTTAHRESIEKLWDAWERLKTIEPGKDKAAQISALLARLSVGAEFRKLIDREGRELTDVGNTFMIRHTETNKIPIEGEVEVDYLFHRLFCLIWILLRETGRAA